MTDAGAQPRLLHTPAGVTLGPLALIPDGKARNFVLKIGAQHFFGFVVRRDGEVRGYVDQCPHAGLPLAQTLDQYLTPQGDLIACSWHGALFRIDDGVCVAGPCAGQGLRPWPGAVRDDALVTTSESPD